MSILICPQFPLYVSPRDEQPTTDVTMPDPEARGVYVDQVLLLPRASQNDGNPDLSRAFRRAHSQGNIKLWRFLHVNSLEIPLLEEKKRPPTRHPRDLEAHIWSILAVLDAAQSQITTQAKILFSSPRFATQNLVILVASSGEYYRLAVLPRGHHALSTLPSNDEIADLLTRPEGNDDVAEVAETLRSELVISARSPAQQERQRLDELQSAENAEREKNNNARDARALARSRRQQALSIEKGLEQELSRLVINAGDPEPCDSYSDDWIEAYHKIDRKIQEGKREQPFHRYPTFFEPEPQSNETLSTFANLRSPKDDRQIVFTGVIRIGSPTSDKFSLMIRKHLSNLARIERSRRR